MARSPATPLPSGTDSDGDVRRHVGAEVDERVAHPLDVDLLAADHVLVGVVELVVGDARGAVDVSVEQREPVAVGLLQERTLGRRRCGHARGRHAFCFSLQLMQTRVQGIASRRARAISSPQSRHTP